MELHNIFTPITATPFKNNDTYIEVLPCEELKPYIRCFWGSKQPYHHYKTNESTSDLVIPDTCVDIIFQVDFSNNKIESYFCGINDTSFLAHNDSNVDKVVSTFGIRFYVWSVALFSEDSMKDTKNASYSTEYHFSKLKRELEPMLFDVISIEDRILLAQNYLLEHIRLKRSSYLVRDAIAEILLNRGSIEISQLSKTIHISTRQLERSFNDHMGISPKQLTSLIRYQYLWNDIVRSSHFNPLDAVLKYGYSDQAHLLREFKKYHAMTIPEARKHAFQHVAFLQEDYK